MHTPKRTLQHSDPGQAMTQASNTDQAIAVVDLGGQYCHMIGRRLRDIGVRADILHNDASPERLQEYAGIILSGGPQSVYAEHAPTIDSAVLKVNKPILGICYGHQLLAKLLRCDVEPGNEEYGRATLHLQNSGSLFDGTPPAQTVWMSHGDSVRRLASGLRPLAYTNSCEIAAFEDPEGKFFGVQFHPEVDHTKYGRDLLRNFSRNICRVDEDEKLEDRVTRLINEITERVGQRSVFFFVSGGVDSTVAFTLCARALARDKVLGVYVDTGLMRKHETDELQSLLATAGLSDRLRIRDESNRFLPALEGETDPETKRKIIGRLFVDVQSAAMQEYGIDHGEWLLGQGTIYPDTVESGGTNKATALIKTHHNRCEEIRQLIEGDRVIEPLTEFYKDEVRQIGKALGLDEQLTSRWPFPGPGLAIRCLCVRGKRRALGPVKLPKQFKGYEAAHFPIRSVGVQGDDRTYREVVALRGPINYSRLGQISTALCNTGRVYNRAVVLVAGDIPDLSAGFVIPRAMDRNRIERLRDADYVVRTIMESEKMTAAVWQFPTILIPVSFSGGESIVLRPINSEDGMTATFARLSIKVLKRIGAEIIKIGGIDAVFLDVTNKPPATIEWE
jgi:GMP synthase (glutamine-hydrolysing)